MEILTVVISIFSGLGGGGIILFFVSRHYAKKDKEEAACKEAREAEEQKRKEEMEELMDSMKASLATVKFLSYCRMRDELDRVIDKGYATPAERHFLEDMHKNYSDHKWNGDMDSRMSKMYRLPEHPPEELARHTFHVCETCDK